MRKLSDTMARIIQLAHPGHKRRGGSTPVTPEITLTPVAGYPPWEKPAWEFEGADRRGLTTNRDDPRLGHGVDTDPSEQREAYLILPAEERSKGFVRPVRRSYRHKTCGSVTTMGQELAETYARDPHFYGATYCVNCRKHLPVSEFTWVEGGEELGT